MRYLDVKKDEYIKWLKEEKGEIFPEEAFNQELSSTIKMELEVSNTLLRTYIERYAYGKCGSTRKFFNEYKNQVKSYKIEYQRKLPKLPVLEINYDLRNYSTHSKPKYESIQTIKTPVQILSEPVIRITNSSGEKVIGLLHDLDKKERKILLDQIYNQIPTGNINSSYMAYGELLREEIIECIRQIDLI